MTVTNLADLLATAQAEGLGSGATNDIIPDGDYDLEVLSVKAGASKNGKPSFGVRLKVVGGAYDGKSTWVNQTLTADNATSVKIFCATLLSFGVPAEAFSNGQAIENLYGYIAKGTQGKGKLSHHVYGDKTFQDLKSFTITGIAAASAQVSGSAVPVIPVVPVPNGNVPPSAPVVVPVPGPAPVVPQPAVAAAADPNQAAAFAAFQAAAAATAAPSAVPAPGPTF